MDGQPELLQPTAYFDNRFHIDAVKLLPGEYYVTQRDMMLVTVLGSCIAACIRDRRRNIAGMNHFMLPDTDQGAVDIVGLPTRYGVYAMEMLINELMKAGAVRANLEAKIFGGGNVLRGFTVSNVGAKNTQFVRQFLETERIPIVAEDVLDVYPRKVYFFAHSGKVMLKKLKSVNNNTIIEREKQYSEQLRYMKSGGDAELF